MEVLPAIPAGKHLGTAFASMSLENWTAPPLFGDFHPRTET